LLRKKDYMEAVLPLPTEEDISVSERYELERAGVEFDAEGRPLWHTAPEWFDELDSRLAEHYGEDYRRLANSRRQRWNKQERWEFEMI